MKTQRLALLLGNISDELLSEAINAASLPHKKKKKRLWRYLAVAACLCLLLFGFTPSGQALAVELKEGLESIIEKLFPPREIPLSLEGMEDVRMHNAHSGRLFDSEETAEIPQEEAIAGMSAGFVIYVDEAYYSFEEQEDCCIIRPLNAPASYEDEKGILPFPECKIVITEAADSPPYETAVQTQNDLSSLYQNVYDIEESALPLGLLLYADNGYDSTSEVAEIYFVDNGQGGTYIITSQYFLEATEGHGARFLAMIKTFEVVKE